MHEGWFKARRKGRAAWRRVREISMIAKGLAFTDFPVQAHIVATRRCNLACAYCNEYDDYSRPVDTGEMLRRIDLLAKLGTTLITISGGEPLLHPELDEIIRRIRHHGRIAGMITNGYLLTVDRIEQLNRARLDHLQISIDNVKPDEVSKKSLKVLDKKLQLLARHALFHVNINSVIGGGVANPEDALVIARRALSLGFSSTAGIIHDGAGQLKPLGPRERAVYEESKKLVKRSFARFNDFQDKIAGGEEQDWRCRAGSRYLYVCEDGLVHYCSQARGFPAKPLELYTVEDIRREFITRKACSPYCTVSCAHQTSHIDHWRAPQTIRSRIRPVEREKPQLVSIR